MGLIDSLKARFASSGSSFNSVINVESRFERMRTSAVGTMSAFFVARDREKDRVVGVKLLDIEKHDLFEARFKGLGKPGEGEIAMGMKHPRVVETYEAGVTTKGQPIIVMEYIEGPSLQHIIVNKHEELVRGRRLMLIREMAEAIQYVHSKGFIHRDICPRNFICLPDMSGIKLIDFGLTIPATAPYMAPGNRTGTPLYMSPEIVRRRHTDQRVDLFSFGVTCFCLCSFKHPWQGDEVNGRAALYHDTTAPTDLLEYCPAIDPRLARSIMSALNPKVEERTATIDQFLQSIRLVKTEF
ncbi:Serine/threonine-protein kinase PknB [Novipirellula aureliae]|uniref:Serine/threonine-protein kinase PknB n=1 Tax=Novipirellula aureliae TaxID=2527966 RepID=A0A5C6DLL1_9BACT|nr:serine/threonine-protein kinase [Novipirellula aureliae]TWU37700.1 Serine/threonine-protein kinase PknB [Novipirellula aureliae]